MTGAGGGPVLLYDGTCGFCARGVRFVLDHERPRPGGAAVRFASLESELGDELRERFPELRGVDSVVWYEPGEDGGAALVRSRAAAAMLRSMGGVWGVLGWLMGMTPRWAADGVYRAVARVRHRLAGEPAACRALTPAERARFLEDKREAKSEKRAEEPISRGRC